MESTIIQLVGKVSIPGGPCYNIGERVAFDEETAQDLIERGVAIPIQLSSTKQLSTPPKDKMVQSPQTKKGGRVRKERTRLLNEQ